MATFKRAYIRLDLNEGAYNMDPADSGKETYKGVARAQNPQWPGWRIIDSFKGKPDFPRILDSNKELQQGVAQFYLTDYWNTLNGNAILNEDIAFTLFDFGVHAGIKQAIRTAQRLVGCTPDGIMGPATLKSINAFPAAQLLTAFALERVRYYHATCEARPKDKKFLFGWIGRALRAANPSA